MTLNFHSFIVRIPHRFQVHFDRTKKDKEIIPNFMFFGKEIKNLTLLQLSAFSDELS